MAKILDWLFGCTHAETSRVFTIDGRSYVVCLTCGKEMNYDLEQMRIA